MPKFNTKRMCLIAVLAALSFLLNMLELKLPGNLKITFDSIPIVVAAMLFGPVDAVLAALMGEFFTQLLSPYGLTATTVLWLIPPALRGAVIGLAARACQRTGTPLERRTALCYTVCILASIVTTAGNTAGLWLDSVLMGYYSYALIFGSAVTRFISGMLTAAAITAAAIPLVDMLRRQNFFHRA